MNNFCGRQSKRLAVPGAAGSSIIAGLLAVLAVALSAEEPPAPPAEAKLVKLPGMVIDRAKGWVDLAATVCLDDGFLELVACTKGSKEHESIVVIDSRPVHVHTALLLLGATNGNPAMRKQVGKEDPRWVQLPPRGDPIAVSLLVPDAQGKQIERPISDFIVRAQGRGVALPGDEGGANVGLTKAERRFPDTFLFAGSHLLEKPPGPRQYLADLSGHVISIATFGDEVLCLPSVHSQANGALEWQVDTTHLPKLGSKITLRLRPRKKKQRSTEDAGADVKPPKPEATQANTEQE